MIKNERAKSKGRVLVTGAAGFLGVNLIKGLLEEGWGVVAFDKHELPDSLRYNEVYFIKGDLSDEDKVYNAIKKVDAVCHLAAFIPPDYVDSVYAKRCLEANGLITLRLAELILKVHGTHLIYFSAGTMYRYSSSTVSEDFPVYPIGKAPYYSMSKLIGELCIEQLRAQYKLPSTALRLASCYGLGMSKKSMISSFMKCASQGSPIQVWNGGSATYDFVYIDDVIRATIAALANRHYGIYNIGSGSAHTILEIAHTVTDTFPESKIDIEVKPPSGSMFKGFPALSIKKAVKIWDYKPRSLRKGLAEYRRKMEQVK
jgi:UDP-glucose 4-epimerase